MFGIYVRINQIFIHSYIFFINIETGIWLRRVCYDRIQKGGTLGVFVLSAFWVRKKAYLKDQLLGKNINDLCMLIF